MNANSRSIFLFSFFILSVVVHATDILTVKNDASRNVYVGIYHQELPAPDRKPGLAQLASSRIFIEAHSKKKVPQIARKTNFDRIMTCAENKELLKPELSNEDLLGQKYHGRNVGDMQGDTFFIGDNDAKLYIYSPTEWKVNQPINQRECGKNTKNLPAMVNNPYKDMVAKVRMGDELDAGEHAFLSQRLPKVKNTLESLTQTRIKRPLTIAIVCNGTGVRSALYCLGALQGLQELGVLDASTYIASAAGATWGISSWYSSGMELKTFNEKISKQFSNGITKITPSQATLIGQTLLTKFVSNQPLGAVDMYGALLSNIWCSWAQDSQHVYISAQADRIKNGNVPMPLYTAVRSEHTSIKHQAYEWNPFEAGSLWMKMYVPIWSFGRKFDKGTSVNKAPELTLGNLMGIWGFQRSGVINQQLEKAELPKKMTTECAKNLVNNLYDCLDSYRSFEAQVPNFTRGMKKSPIPYSILLSLTDAHASMISSAYPVVSGERTERSIDVLLFIDASEKLHALERAQVYAQERNLPFADIASFDTIKDSIITVIMPKAREPLVIYQPLLVDAKALKTFRMNNPEWETRIKNLETFNIYKCMGQGACASDNFVYSADQARQILDLGYLNMVSSQEKIINALAQRSKLNK